MDARYYKTYERFLHSGDKAVVYTHGGTFVAAVEFVDNFFLDKRDLGWTKGVTSFLFPYRIKFKVVHLAKAPVKIEYSTIEVNDEAKTIRANLIDDICFIADKGKTWNQYVQVSIINISEEDYSTIVNAITTTKHA